MNLDYWQHYYVVIQNRQLGQFLYNNREAFYAAVSGNQTRVVLDFYPDGKNHFLQQVNDGTGSMDDGDPYHEQDQPELDWNAPAWICDIHGTDGQPVTLWQNMQQNGMIWYFPTYARIRTLERVARRVRQLRQAVEDTDAQTRDLSATLIDEWVVNPLVPLAGPQQVPAPEE